MFDCVHIKVSDSIVTTKGYSDLCVDMNSFTERLTNCKPVTDVLKEKY